MQIYVQYIILFGPGPPVVIIVVATLSSFLLALVVGVAWIYYRQRNRRRMIKYCAIEASMCYSRLCFRLMRALEADVPRPYSTTWNDYAESYPGKPTSKLVLTFVKCTHYCLRPKHDDFVIDEDDLLIDHDRQIGCGAFARVFLAELRGPSCTATGRTLDKKGVSSQVAVKQARSTSEQAR